MANQSGNIRAKIAALLKKYRKAAGLTIREVSRLLGKSNQTVSAWEHERGQPDADMFIKLRDIYNVPSVGLFFGESLPEPELDDDERELLEEWRSATDITRESALMVLRYNKAGGDKEMRDVRVQLLNERNMRPSQLAQIAGISTSTVDDIVKGRANELNIGVGKMLSIAKALGVSVEYLYNRSELSGIYQPAKRDEARLLDYFRLLSKEGQEKALGYLVDLVDTGKYKKHNPAGVMQESGK